MKKVIIVAVLLGLACTLRAQSTATYDSVPANFVNVSSGNPGSVTFYFGHPVNGEPGTTVLVIQCTFHRAELLTNFDAVGQRQSQFFPITCGGATTGIYERVWTFTLNATPLQESLVMYAPNGTTSDLKLTINSATWTVTNPGKAQRSSGNAQITY